MTATARAKARSGRNVLLWCAAIVGIAVAIFAGNSLLNRKTNTLGNGNQLDIDEALENANQLRGNEYLVKGQIDEKLQWTTTRGQLIFGAGIGALIFLIRAFAGFPDGVAFAVLLMNIAAPLIDHYTPARPFGREKS